MKPIKLGIVGLGFGQFYVRTIANIPDVHLVAVADNNPNLPGGLEKYKDEYGAAIYTDGIEMTEREPVDAVCLCVAPRWREPLIESAARQGLPMLIEKPWAADSEQAARLAAICRKHNATVMTGFSFRFHPVVARLKELMDHELGSGILLNADYTFGWNPPAGHWLWDPANGGGFFNENSCHLFDIVCHLLGRPVSVTADTVNPFGSPSELGASITLKFENGAVAAVTVGGVGAAGNNGYPRLNISTANGQAHMAGHDHIWSKLDWTLRDGDAVRSMEQDPEMLGSTRYTDALIHFCDCVRNGTEPSATIDDGTLTVKLAEAVYESARTGTKISLNTNS